VTEARVTRAHIGARSLAGAVPAWAWVAGIVVVSAAIRFLLARRMVAPWIMVDELIYSELAKSFAEQGRFLIRGVPTGSSYGFVYPMLISPAYRAFASVPDAYEAAKAINSVLMSLAAVPTYLLARRVLDRPLALAAAGLSVAIPSLVYTGMLMTENAFYPIFLCVVLALVRMLERPTRLNQLGLLALCLLAYETRQQALALFPAVLTAPLLLGRRGLSRFRVLYVTVAATALVALVAEAVRGKTPLALLGAYQTAGRHRYSAAAVAKWLLWHVAELDLYLGVVPLSAFLVLAVSRRSLEQRQRAFVAAAGAVTVWMVLEVAAFASLPSVTRVEERNMFYVAPLFLIALLLWIQIGAPRPRPTTVPIVLGTALLVAALPFAKLIGPKAVSDTLALLPLWRLEAHGVSHTRIVATLLSLAAATLFLLVPRRFAWVLPVLVLAYFAVSQRVVENLTTGVSRAALFQGIRSVPTDWVDMRIPKGADVAAIWTGRTNAHVIWENEFFNRRVGPIYDLGRPVPGGLGSKALRVGPGGELMTAAGEPLRERYVLADGTLDLNGVRLASDRALGITLWEVRGPVRAVTQVVGLYPTTTWSRPAVVYRRSVRPR
jgi:Dolichyl-phosphate-mannose-protein mannosyltransferase